MEVTTYQSNLQTIIKIDSLQEFTTQTLHATPKFEDRNHPSRLEVIESMAQAASYHLKLLQQFEFHTFLLSISDLETAFTPHTSTLNYAKAIITIGSCPWDERFNKNKMRPIVMQRTENLLSAIPQSTHYQIEVKLLSRSQMSGKYEVFFHE